MHHAPLQRMPSRGGARAVVPGGLAPARAFAPVTHAAEAKGASPRGAGHDFAKVAVGSGKPLPGEVRSRMERTLNADFSTVRVHEGADATAVGARAFTRGEHLHFAPGEFRPRSGEGMRLVAHELAHVVQQRRGRVRPTGKVEGLALNDDPRLEHEADAAGARAVRNPAPLPASAFVRAPRSVPAPGSAAVAQGWFGWARRAWNFLRRPRNTVTLPTGPSKGKPPKPASLKQRDQHGNVLSSHHKYPSNKIVKAVNEAVSGNTTTEQNVAEWAQRGTRGHISSIGQIAWTPHNVFHGPAPEDREDDPGGSDVDPHFTRSGTVTPRSKLALKIDEAGGLGSIDPKVLKNELAKLSSLEATAFKADEWEFGATGKERQKGKPTDWRTWSKKTRLKYADTSSCGRRLRKAIGKQF